MWKPPRCSSSNLKLSFPCKNHLNLTKKLFKTEKGRHWITFSSLWKLIQSTVWTSRKSRFLDGNQDLLTAVCIVPWPVLRRTPPRNSLLVRASLSQTVSSRHISFSCSRPSSLYTIVWSKWGFRFFFTTGVFLFVDLPLIGNKYLQSRKPWASVENTFGPIGMEVRTACHSPFDKGIGCSSYFHCHQIICLFNEDMQLSPSLSRCLFAWWEANGAHSSRQSVPHTGRTAVILYLIVVLPLFLSGVVDVLGVTYFRETTNSPLYWAKGEAWEGDTACFFSGNTFLSLIRRESKHAWHKALTCKPPHGLIRGFTWFWLISVYVRYDFDHHHLICSVRFMVDTSQKSLTPKSPVQALLQSTTLILFTALFLSYPSWLTANLSLGLLPLRSNNMIVFITDPCAVWAQMSSVVLLCKLPYQKGWLPNHFYCWQTNWVAFNQICPTYELCL